MTPGGSLTIPRPADLIRDQRIERLVPLISPGELFEELPLSDDHVRTVLRGRSQAHSVLTGSYYRLLVVVGPCSVHDPEATLEYAQRLSREASRLRGELLVAMRVYF